MIWCQNGFSNTLDVLVKHLVGSLASPNQKPSIIPHFKFRFLFKAFCGLAADHFDPPSPNHTPSYTLTSVNLPPSSFICSLFCSIPTHWLRPHWPLQNAVFLCSVERSSPFMHEQDQPLLPAVLKRLMTLPFVGVVQSLSCVRLFATPRTAACQACLSFNISRSLLKFMSIELTMPSNHLILCRPLLLLPSIFPSIRVFSNELALHIRWPKYGASTSASVLSMNIQS